MQPTLTPRRRRLLAVTAVAVALAFAMHFAMTFVYVAPMNPVRFKVGATVHEYMLPFFEQNWNLFAPNPISDDRGLLVRARVGGEVTRYADITTPSIRDVQRNRLLPPRRARLPSGAIQNLYWTDPVADTLRRRRPGAQQGGVSVPRVTDDERDTHALARDLMRRLGSAEAVRLWGPGVTAVQVRVVRHEFPPFSRREDRGVGKVFYHDLGWMPVAEVTP